MLTVLRYSMRPGAAERVPEVAPRHGAYLRRFAEGGRIVLIGPLLPAPGSGALAVFRDAESAEAFAAGDPFVTESLAEPQPVQQWDALEFLGSAERADSASHAADD